MSNFTPGMRKRFKYGKMFFAVLFVFAVELAFGSFTGTIDDSKNKFSLKNLNTINRAYSFSALRSNSFHYTGSVDINKQVNGNQMQIQSMIRLEKGNTTYVYPYKYTVKVPRFKTPTPPVVR